MSDGRELFLEEAGECIRDARSELAAPDPDPSVLLSAVRRLRGSAQLARFGAFARLAGGMENRLRDLSEAGGLDGDVARSLGRGLDALEQSLRSIRIGDTEQDTEVESGMDGEATTGPREVVEVEELEYRGRGALERALQVREVLEDAVVNEQPVGPILDELFDLIRLGMK